MSTTVDPALTASELRVVLGQLVRRLRAENRLPLPHASALGRLDREGPQTVSELAAAERVRPQSMAQTVGELESDGLIERQPDPADRRRALVQLTDEGRTMLQADRRQREGWLARAIVDDLSEEEQAVLGRAVQLLRRVAES
ncbi:MAG: MarR family transcriptional regulator [Solirubrobacterales bacterium]|nr:MarR family transcriptional regulator [Solirubrobacterales bacterium]